MVHRLGSARFVFLRIPFLVRFWVSAGHKRHLLGEEEGQPQPYLGHSEGQSQVPGSAAHVGTHHPWPHSGWGHSIPPHPTSTSREIFSSGFSEAQSQVRVPSLHWEPNFSPPRRHRGASFLPHLPVWLTQRLHLFILRWGAQPTRDCTTGSHTCTQVPC